MIKMKTTCHNRCFSLGFHIDLKNMYIDFHIWNWFIEIGNHKASELPDNLSRELRKLNDDYIRKSDEIVKKAKGHHPLAI